MKLATSTTDFLWYKDSLSDMVRCLKETPFRYANLSQTTTFWDENTEWERTVEGWGKAAAEAGITFAVSHAPCLHTPCRNDEEGYQRNMRALRRSLEVCRMLSIPRVVVHACADEQITKNEFYSYNKRFYTDLLEVAERYDIVLLTENWDRAYSHFCTGQEMREFLDYMDHPLLAACWDTAHGNISTAARTLGQYANIVALGDKLKGLHIADNFGDVHHHTWPFAGIINFDEVMQGLADVNYDGFFTFEASYTLMHQNNPPYRRHDWQYNGKPVIKLANPSLELKQKAVTLMYEVGRHMLETYGCFEE